MASIPGVFFDQAERFGSIDFIHHYRDGEWRAITWTEAAQGVREIAARLVEAGVKHQHRVGLISENRFEWLLCDLAIQAAGGVTVPIYPSSTPKVVRHIIEDSGCRIAIASGAELAAKLDLQAPLHRVLRMDLEIAQWLNGGASSDSLTEVTNRLDVLKPNGIATIVYTSGTTGEPKGVILTHSHFVEMAKGCLQIFDLGPTDVLLSWLPYSHIMERIDGFFVPMSAGCTFWLARDMNSVVEDIAAAHPTAMLGVPRIFEKVYEAVQQQVRKEPRYKRALFAWAMDVGRRRLVGGAEPLLGIRSRIAERLVLKPLRTKLTGGRLRFFISGGAPLSEKVEEFFWSLGVEILQGWGLTEATSGATSNTEREHRYRSVGRAIPGTQIKIASDGEILVKGPGVMVGYQNRPEETERTVVDGWLQTGDMGFVDHDGFVFITDRKKDLLKTSGGKYVAPLPIEAQLQANRLVKSAIVVGDEHQYVVALIVPDWAALDAEYGIAGDPRKLVDDERARQLFAQLVESVNSGLASFETIKKFALLPRDFAEAEGELTPTLKMRRKVIAQHFESVIDAMYAAPRAA